MFISNNHALFHLWRKENLLKHQKSQNIMKVVAGAQDFENYVSGTSPAGLFWPDQIILIHLKG